MATKYTLHFSDTSKTPFDLISYTTNGPASPSDGSLIPGANKASTTLKLWGKGLPEYGEPIFQDLVYMLENFANSTRPVNSIEGQTWYNNSVVGSPAALPELFIRNSSANDITGWDAVILATGSSAMTGELILSGNPSNDLGAAPKQYVDLHAGEEDVHLTAAQNTFLDGLTLPTLTSLEVDQLIGVNTTSTIQTQLDGKLNLTGGTLFAAANITFSAGGEVLGLPDVPSVDAAAASKKYVDDQFASGIGGDGVLTQIDWLNTGIGSPAPNVSETTLQLTVTKPDTSTIIFQAEGISRSGHVHTATETPIDNAFNLAYGSTVQTAIEKAEEEITLLKTGGVPPTATISVQRIFENLTSDIISPALWETQTHFADDNRIAITINGVKQYSHTKATQAIEYYLYVSDSSFTGLDPNVTYDFDIAIDGGAPTTISINEGSPLTNIATHSELINAINTALSASSPSLGATFGIADNNTEIFTSTLSGALSSIAITAPIGSPLNTYLFDVDLSPSPIITATFLSNPGVGGSPPPVADTITIAGDQTTTFTVGKTFSIRGSLDATYGSYDGIYSVYTTGAVFDSTNTIIPIAEVYNNTLNVPLLELYDPSGSPTPSAPSPSAFGDIYLTPLGGLLQIDAAVAGVDGDYMETNSIGDPIATSGYVTHVVFNYDILSGSKIESLLYV